jgi:filamentous hemagglutinin family protein
MASNGPAHPVVRSALQRQLLTSILLQSLLLALSQAQLTLDGSLRPGGPLAGPNYRIGAEVGQIRGSNLFQSFGQFNVPTGGSATFTVPDTIANIVSRVTGGQQSAIDGVLRSEIGGANLFLHNPGGVMFGPNASLEVSGSFHVSTADFLRMADGERFSAHLGQESVLTVAPPVAFEFLGPNPAATAIRESVLEVPVSQTLSIIGGTSRLWGVLWGFSLPRVVGFSSPAWPRWGRWCSAAWAWRRICRWTALHVWAGSSFRSRRSSMSAAMGAGRCCSEGGACWSTSRRFMRIIRDRWMAQAWGWTCVSSRMLSLRIRHSSRQIVWETDARETCG